MMAEHRFGFAPGSAADRARRSGLNPVTDEDLVLYRSLDFSIPVYYASRVMPGSYYVDVHRVVIAKGKTRPGMY